MAFRVASSGVLQGNYGDDLSRDTVHKDRYWGHMQRLGGTLSHLLKESPPSSLDLSQVAVPLQLEPEAAAASPPQDVMGLSSWLFLWLCLAPSRSFPLTGCLNKVATGSAPNSSALCHCPAKTHGACIGAPYPQ